MRTRASTAGIIWGLLCCFIAALGLLWSFGVPLRLSFLGVVIPLFLIGLGVLGIALGRRS